MLVAKIAYTQEEIRSRVAELARQLGTDFRGTRPLLVSVLKGSVVFLADLVRELQIDSDIDFMSVSTYGGHVGASGVVRIVKDLEEPLTGRHVVVVEDIVDTGFTLSYLMRTLATREPQSLRICTLVDKTVRRIADLTIDYAGFTSDEFLIGYGLDFQGMYRNLPYLASVSDISALAAQPDSLTHLFQDTNVGTDT